MQQSNLFFNTISLSGPELEQAKDTCNKQEQRVLDLMKRNMPYTPIQVFAMYSSVYGSVLLQSVRRSMTCLTKKNMLIKTTVMRKEIYGSPNHYWMKP